MSTPEITPVQSELATTPADPAIPKAHHGKHWIEDWRPEDPVFWAEKGARIAKKNLVFSVIRDARQRLLDIIQVAIEQSGNFRNLAFAQRLEALVDDSEFERVL